MRGDWRLLNLRYRLGLLSSIDWLRARGVTIGEHCAILDEVYIDPGEESRIQIGDHVTIAPFVKFIAHDASTKRLLGWTRKSPIIVESGVFIGAGALILPGVTIGRCSIVGAGSVVHKDVPPDVVVCGNPAQVKCSVAELLAKRQRREAS